MTLLKNGHTAISAAVALCLMSGQASALGGDCQALINVNKDLWLANINGVLIKRLTQDGKPKTIAALSPDRTLVAYSKDAVYSGQVAVINTQTGAENVLSVPASDAITGLSWPYPGILKVQEHESPYSSRFHFVSVPNGAAASLLNTPAEGGYCVPSPDNERTACLEGDSITNGKKVIYYATRPFTSTVDLQTVNIPSGSVVTTTTSPAFTIQAEVVSPKIVSLRVTAPDGSTQEEQVRVGDTMPLTVPSGELAVVYGFYPEVSADGRTVSVRAVKSQTGNFSFEGGLVWVGTAPRLAVVEVNDAGQSYLVLMNSESSVNSKDASGVFKVNLPLRRPIKSVEVTADNKIRVWGANAIFEQTLSANQKSLTGSYTLTSAPPQKLSVTIGGENHTADVLNWSCN